MIHHTPSVPGFHPAPASACQVVSATTSIFDFHGNPPRYAALAGACVNATTEHDASPANCYPSGNRRYHLREGFVYSDLLAAELKEKALSAASQETDIASLVDGLPLPAPPVSNTGGKVDSVMIAAGLAAGIAVQSGGVVKIDTLTVSLDGSVFGGELPPVRRWLDEWSGGVLTVGGTLSKRFNGYARCFEVLLVSGIESPTLGWLGVSDRGDNMRGRWCLHLTGVACSLLLPGAFLSLSIDLERFSGKITRIDLAVDDLTGEHSVEKAMEQYAMGDFTLGGRPPKFKHICSSDGDTFYVGRRGSGKYYRCYQKGRQLGDESSRWVRHEVEFHAQNRLLPLAMLTSPLEYFKGAYPDIFDWIAGSATMIDTSRAKHKIIFSAAMLFAKRQVGRLVRYCKDVVGYDESRIVRELIALPELYPVRLFFGVHDLDFESRGSVDLEPAF